MDPLLNKIALVVSIGLQLVVLYILVRKHLPRRFFWFFVCLAYAMLEAGLRLTVTGSNELYKQIYWLTTIGDTGLSVLAVRESFLNVFRTYTRLRWFMWIIWGCIVLALVYAVLKAWFFPPIPATRRGAVVIGLELGADYTVAAIGLLYFALITFFRIRDHQWESGIIAGFTIIAVFEILELVARSVFGMRFKAVRLSLPAIAYIIAATGWAVVLSRPERRVPPQRNLTVDDLSKMDHHIALLARLLGRRS